MDEHARRAPPVTASTPQASLRSAATSPLPSEQQPQPEPADLPTLLRQQFGRLLDAIPDGVVVADDVGAIQFVNTQTASLFGYQRDELVGHSVESLMPKRFHGVHPDHRAEYAANPHVRPMGIGLPLFGLRRDGSEFPVEISLSPIEVADTRLVLATIRDVTDRKQVETQLRTAEREASNRAFELDAILETQTDIVALVRPGGSVARLNASGVRLLGRRTKADLHDLHGLVGQPMRAGQGRDLFADLAFYDEHGRRLHPDALPTHRVLQGETLLGPNTMRLLLRRKGEPDVHLEVVGAPIRGSGGVVTGGVVTLRDVTQRAHWEQRTRNALTAVLAMAEAIVLVPEIREGSEGSQGSAPNPTDPGSSAGAITTPLHETSASIKRHTTRSAGESSQELARSGLGRRAAATEQPDQFNAAAFELASLTRAILDCQHVAIAAWDSTNGEMPDVARPVALAGHRHHDLREWRNWLRWYTRRLTAPASRAPDMDLAASAVGITARLMAGATVAVDFTPKPESVPARKRTYAFGHSLLVPMHIGGRFIGCLALDFGTQQSRLALGEDDMALVQAVAKLAALVIERDRLLADHQARVEAEARLTMLQTILDDLPSAVYLARGRDGQLVLANRQVNEVWGAEWREGQPMLDFLARSGTRLFDLHGRPMGPDQLAMLRALRTGESVRQQQEVIRRPDGSSLSVLVNAITVDPYLLPYLSGAYDPTRAPMPLVLVVLQDVSALKEAERLKDEFIAMAAHELRNPIATLAGYAQLLTPQRRSLSGGRGRVRHRVPIEWQAEAATAVQQASERLTALTDDLLDATRLHANRLTLRPEPTELGALVRRVVKRAQVTTRRHTLILEAPSGLVLIEADVQRVEQVLTNLLSNAIKYSPDGGAITVTLAVRIDDAPAWVAKAAEAAGSDAVAKTSGGRGVGDRDAAVDAADADGSRNVGRPAHAGRVGIARIAVRDQGIGIPADDQARIFGRFARAENARQQGIPGTGLGLYLCRELIELQNGRIWFESVEGTGTTFTVELPVWSESEKSGP